LRCGFIALSIPDLLSAALGLSFSAKLHSFVFFSRAFGNMDVMQNLLEGVHRFQQRSFGREKEMFRRLSREGQKPHTLFITCADSRVVAEMITQSKPGDLLVIKNIGNIVPPPDPDGSCSSTGAGIEFAVEVLGVSDIVVCGHSQCGAISALMESNGGPAELKHLRRWISLAEPVRQTIEREYNHLKTEAERIRAAEEENVLFSIERLLLYPCVSKKLRDGTLRLHGWFFKIATAELFAYDPEHRQFQLITEILPGPESS
jgi:carbonic anhydrase